MQKVLKIKEKREITIYPYGIGVLPYCVIFEVTDFFFFLLSCDDKAKPSVSELYFEYYAKSINLNRTLTISF